MRAGWTRARSAIRTQTSTGPTLAQTASHYRGPSVLSQVLISCACHSMDVLSLQLPNGQLINVYFNIDAFFGLGLRTCESSMFTSMTVPTFSE